MNAINTASIRANIGKQMNIFMITLKIVAQHYYPRTH